MNKLFLLLPVIALVSCDKKTDYEIVQNEIIGKEIPIIATGTMGDFMIKIPETKALKKIANKTKNSKFLSVENPNAMSEDGYCLINTIPLNAWEKLGSPNNTCHYRIYCGHLDFMDYDKMYAVEVCE